MKFELFNSQPSKESREDSVEKINNLYQKAPFSIKSALLIISLMGAQAENVQAQTEELSPKIKNISELFKQTSSEMLALTEGADYVASFQSISAHPSIDMHEINFGDFPEKGAGRLIVRSLMVSQDNTFQGITEIYSIFLNERMNDLEKEYDIVKVSITIEEGVDKDQQIVEAVVETVLDNSRENSEEVVEANQSQGQELLVENRSSNIQMLEATIHGWEIDNILSDEGKVVGYEISLQLAKPGL